jgi:hypothetical protein
MRKRNGDSILIAGAIALMMMAPMGTLATDAFAQTGPATTSSPPNSQVPQPDEGGVNWQGVGYGAGTIAADIFYVPAKLVYAVLGGLIGGGAWLVTGGNTQTANTIWRSSLGGDYVVTPDMIAGKEPIHFSGPTETPPPPQDTTVQPITGAAPVYTPAPSYSSAPSYSAPSSYTAPPPSHGAQPMDRGAGSVGAPGGGGGNGPSTLPDTSIE